MNKANPRVSVIIPVYNGATFVGQAITSALNQTYKDFEIIVADDGSTDDTLATLRQFGDQITILELPHAGICATRNAAIRASHGEFIALLDSDDLWEPQKLNRQVAYLDEHPEYGLVYSYSTNFTDESEGNVALVKKVDFQGHIFKELLLGAGFANSSIVMRRAAFDAVGGYDESLKAMEDYELDLRISRHYQIGRVAQVLLRRRIHPGSFYSSGYDNQYTYQLPVFDTYLSDPEVASLLDTTKTAYMSSFIIKFIFKNLYDDLPQFIPQKLKDLERYSQDMAQTAKQLVDSHNVEESSWEPLVPNFSVWFDDVKHKAALYSQRRRENFDVGAKRLG